MRFGLKMSYSCKTMKPRLVFFDIDGTLGRFGSLNRYCIREAFKKMWGILPSFDRINLVGKVDIEIFKELLKEAGLKNLSTSSLLEALKLYADIYVLQMENWKDYELFAGVKELLLLLKNNPGIYITLLTGNVKEVAWAKIKKIGLTEFFLKDAGTYGEEAMTREQLVSIGIDKCSNLWCKEWYRIFLVGDSPLDVYSARKNNITSIAVGTGFINGEELKASNPDYFYNDFKNYIKIYEVISK